MPRTNEQTKATTVEGALYMSMDLGGSKWTLAFSDGRAAEKARVRNIPAGELEALMREVRLARQKFGLSDTARVRACYEAGRDGFWVYRALVERAIDVLVIDAASVETRRHARAAKTDRIDAGRMLRALLRYHDGETTAFAVVRVPSCEDEDRRHLSRERDRVMNERKSLRAGILARLALHGIRAKDVPDEAELDALQCYNGAPLPKHALAELRRMLERLALVDKQHAAIVAEQKKDIVLDPKTAEQVRRLVQLCGVGPIGACVLVAEIFAWRKFTRAKEVGACIGLAPTPFRSDGIVREQGVSRRGSPRVRALLVELAWLWLRYQPDSALARWFQTRFAQGGARARRVGIVALARKLLVALWRCVETGAVPEGAVTKAA